MIDQIRDILQRLVHGEDVSHTEALWGALLVGLLFATVHLITMMVTRWGDHQATSKSLIFSIIVHLSCGFGLVAVNPPARAEPPKPPKKEDDPAPFRIVEVRLDGAETFETDVAGNTPFEKLPPPEQVVMTRREMLPFDLQPVPDPERNKKTITPHDISDPNLPALPDSPIAAPSPQNSPPKTGPMQIVSIPNRMFDQTAQRQPEVRNPSPLDSRVNITRPAQTKDPVVRETALGSAEKVEPDRDLNITTARDEAPPKPDSPFRPGQPRPFERRRAAPTRTPAVAENSGATARRVTPGTAGSNPQPERLTNLRTRPIDSVPLGGIDRFNPKLTPMSPTPTSDRKALRNVPTVDALRAGPQPNVLRSTGPIRKTRRVKDIPATYRLRSLANRKAVAEKFGGTDASEKAVEAALRWLAANQHADGYWDAGAHGAGTIGKDEKGIDRQHAGLHADTGLTALALLAFLGAGYTHEEGPYARTVDKAITWLISQQQDDGFLGGKASHYAKMYCHGMATYALAEAYGMQSDPTIDTRLKAPLRKAVGYILENQNPKDGGWRYLKGQVSDVSMFGWQLMALKSAEIAGIPVPDSAKRGMIQFLKEHSYGPKKGLAAYQKDYPVSETMTAEALFCKQMFRIPREHAASKEAVDYLMARLPRQSKLNLYYWYYGTLAMYQYGGPEWKTWNDAVREALIARQDKTGTTAGSWDPKGPWGPYGGRVFSTAVSAMCLEVYYRFLPLYKISGRGNDGQ